MSDPRSRILVGAALAALLGGVLTAPASADTSHFKGKTEQGSKVTFTASPKKVSDFKASVWVLCVSVVSGRSAQEAYPFLFRAPKKLKNGKFTLVLDGENSLKVTVKGKVTGDSAKGSLDVRYNKTIGYTSNGLLDIAACTAKTTWKAKRK